jgi:hypothetical protein
MVAFDNIILQSLLTDRSTRETAARIKDSAKGEDLIRAILDSRGKKHSLFDIQTFAVRV